MLCVQLLGRNSAAVWSGASDHRLGHFPTFDKRRGSTCLMLQTLKSREAEIFQGKAMEREAALAVSGYRFA